MEEQATIISDRYKIIQPLGEGGMATVYQAYDTRLERNVAVKVIRKENFTPAALDQVLKRFEREAKSLAQLSHPNIVKVIDFGEFNGSPYLILEYLSGGTLRQHLVKPIPFAEAAQFIVPVTRALSYAHQRNIIHRDIKPSNILLTDSGEPMLSDFGIAKILTGDEIGTLTGSGIIVGTPEYIAPEQGLGNPVDARTDVYALGVVIYEMITGCKPFQADTPMGVVIKHISEPPPPPHRFVPGIPVEAEQTILKALAKDPLDRFQDMSSLALALSGLASRVSPSQETYFTVSASAQTMIGEKHPTPGRVTVSKPPSQPSLEDTPRLVARVARLEKAISDALTAGDIEDAEGLLANLENLGERGQQAAARYRSQLLQAQADQQNKQQAEVATAIKEIETRLGRGNIQQAEDGLLKLENDTTAPRSEIDRLRRAVEDLKQKEIIKNSQSETQPELLRPVQPVTQASLAPGVPKVKLAMWLVPLILLLVVSVGAALVLPRLFERSSGKTQETQPSSSLALNTSAVPIISATPEAIQAMSTSASSSLPPVATQTTRPVNTPRPSLTATRAATRTPLPTLTPSPGLTYQVRVKVDSANVRSGPGTSYGVISKLGINDSLVASGRNAQGDWLVLSLTDGRPGWVAISILDVTFDPQLLPVVAAPPTPVIISSPTSPSGPVNPPTRTSPPPEPPTWTPPPVEPPTWTPPPP